VGCHGGRKKGETDISVSPLLLNGRFALFY